MVQAMRAFCIRSTSGGSIADDVCVFSCFLPALGAARLHAKGAFDFFHPEALPVDHSPHHPLTTQTARPAGCFPRFSFLYFAEKMNI